MLLDARYVAKLLYEALVRHNGDLIINRDLAEKTFIEIETHEDLKTFQEAMKFLVEHEIAAFKPGTDPDETQILLRDEPPVLDDDGIYPWETKTNLREKLSPKVLRELDSLEI